MPLIALEFLDDQILVAATRPGKTSRLEIQKLFSIPLTGNEEASEASIAAALKKGLAQHRLTRAEAILVLKRTSVEIREMVVPPAPDNELPGMVRMMAASKFSSFHDDAILDFIVRGTDATAPRDVLAFLLPQKSYERITRIASEAGIKIRQIVLRPLATVQLASSPSSNAKPTLLIDAGPDEADLTLFSEEGLLTTRTVRLPAEGPQRETALLREIQRTLVSSSDPSGDRPQASLVLIDDSQWLHFGGSVELQALLSVRLQFLHLWSIIRSASLAIGPATLQAFFNLSYASAGPTGPFAYGDEVLEYPRTVLGIVDFGVELQAEAVSRLVLHSLHLARVAVSGDAESGGRLRDLVVVALPHRLLRRSALEQLSAATDQRDRGGAELWLGRLGGLAAVVASHELVPGAYP